VSAYGIFPAIVIISGFLPGHPPCCGFHPVPPRKLPQNIAVKQAAGRFTRYTQHITDQATGQDMFHTLTGRH
ncbi:hypothetical protein JYI49_23650, partial [Escherichia fergusonii]|nr:hypothetical protein [Escherichia fergusonii]